MASVTGIFYRALREFGMGRTVREEWTGSQHTLVNGRVADLTRSVRTVSKSLESAVNVIQRRLDGADTLVGEFGHGTKLPALRVAPLEVRKPSTSQFNRDDVGEHRLPLICGRLSRQAHSLPTGR